MKIKNKYSQSISNSLTNDQEIAYKAFRTWLKQSKNKNTSIFVLSGYAGSGKTFLSMRFLQLAEQEGFCWTVAAPTHKAVGVLQEALEKEGIKPTWHPSTIHRLLRLKLKRERDLEICESTDQTASSLEQVDLVLVDEASMVSSSLLEIILSCANPFKTRVVFVGDSAQLPPVGEEKSPVFSIQNSLKAELEEVVRHRGAVLGLASNFREGSIPCKTPPCLPIIEKKQESVGFVNKNRWLEEAKKSLNSAALNDNPNEARILCYTNRTLEKLVPHARRAVHGEMADQLPVLPGELLLTREAIMTAAAKEGTDEREEPGMVLGSNRELMVNDVSSHRFDISKLDIGNTQNIELPPIETQLVNVHCGDTELELRLLPPIGTKGRVLLDMTLNRLKNKAKDLGRKDGRSVWRVFFLIRDSFASLGPASVLTIHRSQGSSFDEVFIAPDVFWPKDITLRKQLVYVAVTRARRKVWMVGKNEHFSVQEEWGNQLSTY